MTRTKGPMTQPRWVGFDMDECLGSFMSVWPYCDVLLKGMTAHDQDHLLTRIAQRLAGTHSHWLFRPNLRQLLDTLRKAEQTGAIAGCFILSNNGSACLVELVRRILNCYTGSSNNPTTGLFKAGWHRTAACRRGKTTKTWEQVVDCLTAAKLPAPKHIRDLLFYDDLDHVMATQIPHYVKVPPYFYTTPTATIFRDLKPVFQREGIPMERLMTVRQTAEEMESHDLAENHEIKMQPPTPAEIAGDIGVFMEGFRRFMETGKSTKRSRTANKKMKPTRRRLQSDARKITRRIHGKKGLWARY